MTLFVGTRDGLYRTPGPTADLDRVLDEGTTRAFVSGSDVFAIAGGVAGGDLYRSSDGGDSWDEVGLPEEEITTFLAVPGGNRLYVGTYPPAGISLSTDGGDSWHELDFPDLPPRERWWPEEGGLIETSKAGGRVSSLAVPPGQPDRVVAGVEPEGVYVSEDRGGTWTDRSYGLQNDVHRVLARSPTAFVAACGEGLYRTGDAGRTWARLDTGQTYLGYAYFHDALVHDGVLYTAAAGGPPGTWRGDRGADTLLFESPDGGETFERSPYPGEPEEYVMTFATADGRALAGTVAQDLDVPGTTEARLLERTGDGEWETARRSPAGVVSLTVA